MKTSNIILTTYIGILAVGFTIAIVKHSSALNEQSDVNQLKEIAIPPFNKINLKGNLHVTLVQSHEQKVAIEEEILTSDRNPRIEVTENTLWIDATEITVGLNEPINLAIYTPSLDEIAAEKVKHLGINQWNSAHFKLNIKSTPLSIKKLITQNFEATVSSEAWINIDSCTCQIAYLQIENAGMNIHFGDVLKVQGDLLSEGKFYFGCSIDTLQLSIDKTSTLNKYR